MCSKIKARPVSPTPTPTATPTSPFSNLTKIPATSQLVQSNVGVSALAVSGQPPALLDIPVMDIKSLYWQSGLIEGVIASTANANQCSDFWFGNEDGESGGMNACNMTAQLGYTLNPIMAAGVTLCRMKAMPNPQLATSGAIQLTAGSPEGALHLFEPGSENKLVRVQITGQQHPALVFARVYSSTDNASNGYQYHADLWQCGDVTQPAVFRHSIIVNNNNHFSYGFYSHQDNPSAGGRQFVVEAGLAQEADGTTHFDLTQERSAVIEHLEPNGSFGFRQDIRLTPENLLKIKSRWLFDYGWRTDYIVSRFTGTNIRDLRFHEGAIKALDHNNGEPEYPSINGVEYRTDRYSAAPTNSLLAQASEANFSTDTFFANPPSVQIDTSNYPCNLTPNIGLLVDGDNPAVASIFSECDAFTIWSTNFCAIDSQVSQAKQNWNSYCPAVIGAAG